MKDIDLRGIILRQFYERRTEGPLGIHTHGSAAFKIPGEVKTDDVLRVCKQLGAHGLIEWHAADNEHGAPLAGIGKITASGIDVIDGGTTSPIALHIDSSQHSHTVTVSGGTVGNLQVGGANNTQQQNVTQAVERLLAVIDESSGSDEEKVGAKSKVAAFIHGAIKAASEGGARAVIDLFKG